MTRPHKRQAILVNNKLTIYTHNTNFTCTNIISRERDRKCLPFIPCGIFLILPRSAYSILKNKAEMIHNPVVFLLASWQLTDNLNRLLKPELYNLLISRDLPRDCS